jgi:hypothetical protein
MCPSDPPNRARRWGELRTAAPRNRGGVVAFNDCLRQPNFARRFDFKHAFEERHEGVAPDSSRNWLDPDCHNAYTNGLTKGAQRVRRFAVTSLLIVGKRIAVGG